MTRISAPFAGFALIMGLTGGLTAAPAQALGLMVEFPTLTWPVASPAPTVDLPAPDCTLPDGTTPATCIAPTR